MCKRLGASADWDSLGVSNSFLYIFIQETGQRDCSWVFKYSPCPLFNRALMNTMHRILCFKFLFNLCRLFFFECDGFWKAPQLTVVFVAVLEIIQNLFHSYE